MEIHSVVLPLLHEDTEKLLSTLYNFSCQFTAVSTVQNSRKGIRVARQKFPA